MIYVEFFNVIYVILLDMFHQIQTRYYKLALDIKYILV